MQGFSPTLSAVEKSRMTNLRRTCFAGAAAVAILVNSAAPPVGAQTIASRVAQVRDGKVRLTFASRPEICGSGSWFSSSDRNSRQSWSSDPSSDVIYDDECRHTPVRIVLTLESGRVSKLKTYVGGRWRPADSEVTDLGIVGVKDATDYLLGLAASDGQAGRDAILPATLADSVVVWPRLLSIARDERRPSQTRSQARFWLGQAAADRVSPSQGRLARLGSDEDEIKKSAVFALSQRRNEEAVSALIQVARLNRDPEVRKSALFWLGQTSDVRALALFEEILRRD